MYGMISDPRIGYYPPRVALALRTPGWGFHTMRGGIDQGEHRFRPRLVGVVVYGNIYDPGTGYYPLRVAKVLRSPGCGFHTVRGGIDPGDHRFRTRFVGVVNVWKVL